MAVGGNGGSVRNVIPDAGNDGVDVRDIVTNGWNCRTRVYCNFLLGAGVNNGHQATGCTLKTCRILSRLNLRAAIASLYFLRVEMARDHVPFIPLDASFLRISVTVLR